MGGGLGVVGLVCVIRAARFSRLVVMFSCLDESISSSRVGPGSRFARDDSSIVCHLWQWGLFVGREWKRLV